MNQENFEFVEELDTKEERHFIYKNKPRKILHLQCKI